MNHCSPNFADQTVSCFTKEALLDIVKSYNRSHPDQIKINKNFTKKDIWEAIQSKMKDICGTDETCWIEQGFVRNKSKLSNYFKPLAPLGQYQWLSTVDIHKVMKQYDQKHKDYKFVRPLPMDFLKLAEPDAKYLQNLDLSKEAKKGYNNIGLIFNLDPSTKGGSHWVCMNISVKKKEIQYFDSYGDNKKYPNKYLLPFEDSDGKYHRTQMISLPPELQEFVFKSMKKVTPFRGGGKRKMPYTLRINTIQHQFANSECGIYAMLFLLKARTMSFENITKDIITDEKANKFRNKLFRR